jgi:hypothetical protein
MRIALRGLGMRRRLARRLRRWLPLLLLGSPLLLPLVQSEAAASEARSGAEVRPPARSARELIAAAIDQTRGRTSYVEMEMEVHRPDWSRTSAIVAWTRGREDALIRFTGPPRDAGNATLKEGEQMWTFTPRLNRVVRLPYSMMSQSWAGSDFSYNDLSRTDALLRHYQHELVETREEDGLRIYTLDSIPDADAPVVWGRQRLVMREDFVMLEQTFFDQDGIPLKRMETLEIAELGGRLIPRVMRMWRLDEADHWTEVRYRSAEFDLAIPDRRFTLFALRNQDGRSG